MGKCPGDSAMLPLMPGKRSSPSRIAILGAGNLASALAASLRGAGYGIDLVVSPGRPGSSRGRRLARELGPSASLVRADETRAEVFWFCVPDSVIASTARSIANADSWNNKIALHSSGALSSDELQALRAKGAAVASVHPLMTFVRGSRPALKGVPFGIEGDAKAVRVARSIVRDLKALPFDIRKQDKALYHAWGMFLSPLLTALLAASEKVAAAAGIPRAAAKKRMLPILAQTLANYARFGAPGSFSGPIARGDSDTVRQHLKVLRDMPEIRGAYIALARIALQELPAKNRLALQRLLKGVQLGAN